MQMTPTSHNLTRLRELVEAPIDDEIFNAVTKRIWHKEKDKARKWLRLLDAFVKYCENGKSPDGTQPFRGILLVSDTPDWAREVTAQWLWVRQLLFHGEQGREAIKSFCSSPIQENDNNKARKMREDRDFLRSLTRGLPRPKDSGGMALLILPKNVPSTDANCRRLQSVSPLVEKPSDTRTVNEDGNILVSRLNVKEIADQWYQKRVEDPEWEQPAVDTVVEIASINQRRPLDTVADVQRLGATISVNIVFCESRMHLATADKMKQQNGRDNEGASRLTVLTQAECHYLWYGDEAADMHQWPALEVGFENNEGEEWYASNLRDIIRRCEYSTQAREMLSLCWWADTEGKLIEKLDEMLDDDLAEEEREGISVTLRHNRQLVEEKLLPELCRRIGNARRVGLLLPRTADESDRKRIKDFIKDNCRRHPEVLVLSRITDLGKNTDKAGRRVGCIINLRYVPHWRYNTFQNRREPRRASFFEMPRMAEDCACLNVIQALPWAGKYQWDKYLYEKDLHEVTKSDFSTKYLDKVPCPERPSCDDPGQEDRYDPDDSDYQIDTSTISWAEGDQDTRPVSELALVQEKAGYRVKERQELKKGDRALALSDLYEGLRQWRDDKVRGISERLCKTQQECVRLGILPASSLPGVQLPLWRMMLISKLHCASETIEDCAEGINKTLRENEPVSQNQLKNWINPSISCMAPRSRRHLEALWKMLVPSPYRHIPLIGNYPRDLWAEFKAKVKDTQRRNDRDKKFLTQLFIHESVDQWKEDVRDNDPLTELLEGQNYGELCAELLKDVSWRTVKSIKYNNEEET